MPTRRGFLKFLGKGGMAGAALAAPAAGLAMGVDKAKGEDLSMFNFTCACGFGFSSKVPHEEGAKVEFECDCGTGWTLEWAGDHFKTRMRNRKYENPENSLEGVHVSPGDLWDFNELVKLAEKNKA